MAFRFSFASLFLVLALVFVVNVQTCNCKAFGPLTSESGPSEVFQQAYDVVTGERELKIKGNILNGDAEISTSYTNEEIMEMVAIGGGILLALVCCGVCCKHCICPSKRPTVILYQQMPSNQPQTLPRATAIQPGVNSMIPMRNQGFPEIHSQYPDPSNTSPPPPYPGISSY